MINQILNNPTITQPTGFCSPRINTSSFKAKYTIAVFIDVVWENKLSFEGDCDNKPQDVVRSGNYTVPGGNMTFTFNFRRVGNDADGNPTFLCSNIGSFTTRWTSFLNTVNQKMSANTLDEVDEWPDGVCTKLVESIDRCGRPTQKIENRTLTRKMTRTKTPSVRYDQSIVSQDAVCTFN